MTRLQDLGAVVTGAARGIGLAICERFVAEGARVLMSDISPDLESTAARLGQPFFAADVSKPDQVEALFAAADAELASLDILVNNAGITHAANFLDVTEAAFDRVIGVNVKGPFLCSQAAARRMIAQERGSIINLSSINAVVGIATEIPYSVSKGAVRQLTNVSAQALAPYGVRVNAIGPGTIETEMVAATMSGPSAAGLDGILSRTPLGRMGRPEEIASVAVFLASEDASYVTGQTIYPDGGRLALNYTVPVAG